MNVSIHTHSKEEATIGVRFHHSTDWNPYLTIKVTPTAQLPFAIPSEVTVHLDGLSIEEADAFLDEADVAIAEMQEWNRHRKADANLELEA